VLLRSFLAFLHSSLYQTVIFTVSADSIENALWAGVIQVTGKGQKVVKTADRRYIYSTNGVALGLIP